MLPKLIKINIPAYPPANLQNSLQKRRTQRHIDKMAIPHIRLLCMEKKFSDAFTTALEAYTLPTSVKIDIHNFPLSQLPASFSFDTVVSPANSYGRLDGAFDDAISRAFSPKDDYFALTQVAQRLLYRQWRGFAPPGTCTLVRIPDSFQLRSNNVWGTKRVALCPTMRVPRDTRWDKEVVYECIWSLLCAIDSHNRDVKDGKVAEGEEEIQTVLMTPLATGCGRVSPERWATQLVLALTNYASALEDEEKWSSLEWDAIDASAIEVERTWQM